MITRTPKETFRGSVKENKKGRWEVRRVVRKRKKGIQLGKYEQKVGELRYL